MRILELFAGIGAVAHGAADRFEVAAAIDINENAKKVYQANFDHSHLTREISSLSDQELSEFDANIWWMSPPCQPFTRRGKRQDVNDLRAQPMLRIFDAIKKIKPKGIVLENVVGFENSQAWSQLKQILSDRGYHFDSAELCSSMFGLPNLRPRIFVVASGEKKVELLPPKPIAPQPLEAFLDSPEDRGRWTDQTEVDSLFIKEYAEAINLVTAKSTSTRCFTSAYGKSQIQSGSYLELANSDGDPCFRRLSPTEMLRLFGFADSYQLPCELSARQLWKLIGNSVSVPCVRHALDCFG